jgi:hypothetical protein
MNRALLVKSFILLIFFTTTIGCNEIAQVVTPTCSDETTFTLVRQILSDNIVDADHQLSPEELKKRLTFTLPHATKLEENIRKYTCEATLTARSESSVHKMSLVYESQLDDNHNHLVQITNLTNGDVDAMKSILTANTSNSNLSATTAQDEEVGSTQKNNTSNSSLSEEEAFNLATSQTCGEVADKKDIRVDMNNDGINDLVSIFLTEVQCPEPGELAGNSGGRHVVVFLGSADGKFIFHVQDELNVNSIDFDTITPLATGAVKFTALQLGENDSNCCPTMRENALITLSKTGISQIYSAENNK